MTNYLQIDKVLIDYNLCAAGKYLQEYKDLLLKNLSTNYTRAETHKHHAIPCAYYEKLAGVEPNAKNRSIGLAYAKQDQNNFTVNLTTLDHIRAHCYLALASKRPWFTYMNIIALQLLGCEQLDPEELLRRLDGVDSIEVAIKTRCWVHNEEQNKQILASKLEEYLMNGWQRGFKQTLAKKASEKSVGKIWMHYGTLNEKVEKNKILEKLKQGWQLGSDRRCKLKSVCYVHKLNCKPIKISSEQLVQYLEDDYFYGKSE